MFVLVMLYLLVFKINCEQDETTTAFLIGSNSLFKIHSTTKDDHSISRSTQQSQRENKEQSENIIHLINYDDSEFPLENCNKILLDNHDAEISGQGKGIKRFIQEAITENEILKKTQENLPNENVLKKRIKRRRYKIGRNHTTPVNRKRRKVFHKIRFKKTDNLKPLNINEFPQNHTCCNINEQTNGVSLTNERDISLNLIAPDCGVGKECYWDQDKIDISEYKPDDKCMPNINTNLTHKDGATVIDDYSNDENVNSTPNSTEISIIKLTEISDDILVNSISNYDNVAFKDKTMLTLSIQNNISNYTTKGSVVNTNAPQGSSQQAVNTGELTTNFNIPAKQGTTEDVCITYVHRPSKDENMTSHTGGYITITNQIEEGKTFSSLVPNNLEKSKITQVEPEVFSFFLQNTKPFESTVGPLETQLYHSKITESVDQNPLCNNGITTEMTLTEYTIPVRSQVDVQVTSSTVNSVPSTFMNKLFQNAQSSPDINADESKIGSANENRFNLTFNAVPNSTYSDNSQLVSTTKNLVSPSLQEIKLLPEENLTTAINRQHNETFADQTTPTTFPIPSSAYPTVVNLLTTGHSNTENEIKQVSDWQFSISSPTTPTFIESSVELNISQSGQTDPLKYCLTLLCLRGLLNSTSSKPPEISSKIPAEFVKFPTDLDTDFEVQPPLSQKYNLEISNVAKPSESNACLPQDGKVDNGNATHKSIYYAFHSNKTAIGGEKYSLRFVSDQPQKAKAANNQFGGIVQKINKTINYAKIAHEGSTKSPVIMLSHHKQGITTASVLKKIFGMAPKRAQTKMSTISNKYEHSQEECNTLSSKGNKLLPFRHKGGDPGNHYLQGKFKSNIPENVKDSTTVKTYFSETTCLTISTEPRLTEKPIIPSTTGEICMQQQVDKGNISPLNDSCLYNKDDDIKDILPISGLT